ncbi:tetratricopeptide repeat protein [Aureispira anguillae]|uniref:Tetratricopeptide repeat protein n=1 Tax=Aureispira anguillae TaxID=2864201 RepID=A0A915YFX3_9BACT|nr:hypothetical protein [Aureispira anguillae]BDS12243.1 hypothetical protein AsAng_0029620 [Aureispira anguillae]
MLNPQEIKNLSSLLISSNDNSVEIAFQLLTNYNEVIEQVTKELVLIAQLSWNDTLRKQAYQFLQKQYDTKQLEQWNEDFRLFHIYNNLFDIEDFDKNWEWFERHELVRLDYMPLIIQNSEYAGEYFAIAETLAEYYKKRLDWAERYYHIPLAHNPQNLNVLITLANLYKNGFHHYDKALLYYNKMLYFEETHYDALEAKGTLLLEYMKKVDEAIKTFELALNFHPQDEVLRIWLADAYMEKNTTTSFPLGKKILETLLEQSPSNSFAWTIYGNRLWLTENKPKEAELAYKNGLKHNPRNYNILGNLAELYDCVYKDYEQAKEYYLHAFAIYMDDAFHLSNYIRMLVFAKQDIKEAKDYYIHLQTLCFGAAKREPEFNDLQWKQFQQAEAILWEQFPELKKNILNTV